MKTATVRDLRNHYTKLFRWLESGEEIAISRRGAVVARLVPEKKHASRKVDWSKSPEVLRDRSKERMLSAEESAELIREASGRW